MVLLSDAIPGYFLVNRVGLISQSERETKYVALRKSLEENVRSRSKGDERFQQFVAEELASLKNALLLEGQVCSTRSLCRTFIHHCYKNKLAVLFSSIPVLVVNGFLHPCCEDTGA